MGQRGGIVPLLLSVVIGDYYHGSCAEQLYTAKSALNFNEKLDYAVYSVEPMV